MIPVINNRKRYNIKPASQVRLKTLNAYTQLKRLKILRTKAPGHDKQNITTRVLQWLAAFEIFSTASEQYRIAYVVF